MKKTKIKYKGKLKSYMQWPVVFLVIMAIMNVVVYTVSIRAGFIVSGFLALFVVLSLLLIFRHRPLILNDLISFATQYGQVQKTLLDEFSIPYALLDSDGRLIWMNEEFSLTVGKDKDYRKNIQTLFPEIHSGTMPGLKGVKEIEIHYEDRDFCARLQRVSVQSLEEAVNIIEIPQDRNYVIALYLFDNTELNHYIQENQDQKMVPGLIYLDNYDEALDSVEEVRRSLLVALIDRKITKYISNYDGIVKKFETDKYFIVIKNKYLKELQANRFSLLEEVKAVNIGNEMSVTLSIGIGVNGGSYQQNYEFSRIAIELALGRGGDQAAEMTPDGFTFYGGVSHGVEKRSKVRSRIVADQLVRLVKEADHVVIMGHRMSDLDAIGAAEGVLRICKICDVPAVIAVRRDATLAGSLIDALCRAGQADDFIDPKGALPIISKKTLCVVVDTYQLGLVESKEILERCGKVAVIDHHRKGVGFIERADLVCHEPYSSSASELVTELLQYVGDRDDKPSRVEAEGLLSGIMLDTRDFTLHTGVRTFEAAAALRRYGAETERVRQLFDVTMVEYNAKADLVEGAQMYRNCAISVSGEVPPEARVAIAQAANDLLTIQNVEASFVAVQVGSGVNISARSLGAVNVQVIMESLGGGGHQTMAAAQLKHITPEAARARIQTAIDQYRESQKKPLSKNEPESRKKEKQG